MLDLAFQQRDLRRREFKSLYTRVLILASGRRESVESSACQFAFAHRAVHCGLAIGMRGGAVSHISAISAGVRP